ncbi:ABC transporter substrate-binding protein [Corynebacterium kutscheri]|uniref:ABC transporter substrate-binding protein n=1 Tax=Corynebacterium kutscheri TaxID=35755 RepID=UPI0037BE4643
MRKSRTFIKSSVAVLMATSLIVGCSSQSDQASEQSATTQANATAHEPHLVSDHNGHEAMVPGEINRVVFEQIPLMSTFLAFHDGQAPGLVGASAHLINQMDQTIVMQKAPEALDVDTSFDDKGVPSAESLAALHPDVVFNNAFNEKNSTIIDSSGLTRVGFKTVGAPTETYVEWFELLEEVYGTPGKTKDKVAAGSKIIDDVTTRVNKVDPAAQKKVLVVMGAGQGILRVAGGRAGWFTESWADRMNFHNVSAGTDQSAVQANVEQITAWDPDVILVTGRGMSSMTAAEILGNQIEGMDLSNLRAVKDKQVFTTELGMWNWFTPSPDAPLVAAWLGEKLYPEQFSDVDLAKLTKDHYKLNYGWELSDAEITRILDPDA